MPIEKLRVAILNYLVAKQRNEPFLVRMEDIDTQRNIEGKDTEIMQILEKFALLHDQVFHQSEHLHMYQTLAIRLLEEKKAFVCTCPSEYDRCHSNCESLDRAAYAELKESGEPFVIRIRKPEDDISFHDLIMGDIVRTPEEIGDFTILRTDATPTYDFACACDDMLSNISLVLREERYLGNTPRQIHIKERLGYEEVTQYGHLPSLTNGESLTVLQLFQEGFIPDAIINYLIGLGYPESPEAVFYFPDAIGWFDVQRILDRPVTFDIGALRILNREHLRMMDDKRLSTLFGFADADIGKLAKVYLEEASTINELAARIRPVLAPKRFEGEWEASMRQIQHVLIDAPMFETFDELKAYVTEETGLEGEALLTPLRWLLTGDKEGPALDRIYPYIRSYLLEVIS
jgi:glutamyl-tRNA synthetase